MAYVRVKRGGRRADRGRRPERDVGPGPLLECLPAPGWSSDGHRIKAALDYGRGPDKVWVYGGLRLSDGPVLTFTAPFHNTAGFLKLLDAINTAYPDGDFDLINDHLSSDSSGPIREWLREHPRVHQDPVPTGACWLNLIEGWWRIFRRTVFAGQSFADHHEIETATDLASNHLTVEPSRGSGDDLPVLIGGSDAVLSTCIEEWSIRSFLM